MKLPIPLRRRAVLWLLPPAAVLLIVVNNASSTSPPLPGLWTWTVAHSVLLLIVPAAVAATGAALEAARLRTRALENAVNIRAPLVVVLNAIWPSFAAGLVLQAMAVGVVANTAWGGQSGVPWALVLAIASILLFHTTAGFLMGSLMRPMIGVPIALALSYSWLGFTGTFDWYPLRHLAGLVLETCCFYDEQLNPLSALAAIIFSTLASVSFSLWAAFALRLIPSGRTQRVVIPTAMLALATTGGLLVSANLTSTAAETRHAGDLRCSEGDVVVCLYPEQLAIENPTGRIQEMIQRVASLGIAIPQRVVAGRAQTVSDEIAFRYVPGMTDGQIASSLASSFQGDQWLACPSEPVERAIARQQVGDVTRTWLALRFSDTSSTAAEDSDPLLRALMLAPADEQASWIIAGLASMDDCLASVPEAPS